MLLFCKASKRNAKNIATLLNAYEKSGQQVNYQKSSIYFGKAKGYVLKYEISRILSMSRGSLPFKYLGCEALGP